MPAKTCVGRNHLMMYHLAAANHVQEMLLSHASKDLDLYWN